METQDWRAKAACVGENPELWFSLTEGDRQVAQLICSRCPVRRECGEYAVEIHADKMPIDRHGVWGDVDFNKPRFDNLMARKADRAARTAAAAVVDAGRSHCRNGHELTPENRYVRDGGQVECRVCKREADRRRTPRNRLRKAAA